MVTRGSGHVFCTPAKISNLLVEFSDHLIPAGGDMNVKCFIHLICILERSMFTCE